MQRLIIGNEDKVTVDEVVSQEKEVEQPESEEDNKKKQPSQGELEPDLEQRDQNVPPQA